MTSQKKWQDCDTGVIDQMLSDQQKEQARITRRRAFSAIAAGSVGCVGAVVYFGSKEYEPADTQIACKDVHKDLQAFVDNDISDLYLRGIISRHLFVCEACQKAYQGMIDGSEFACGPDEKPA
jgi:hypothetical protein